ncbi:hypothetical protein PRUB_a0028 [Pseudoalteromonas rubra]|uniref:Uncharacterized protein n=1 Tax=Pseudoalteromonas rubra TaxID=43658 RepID=A0A8T0C4K9_9GAMM|nr:hypothetical protein PRUB_a0028 [Pseudoalteromonas rubra]
MITYIAVQGKYVLTQKLLIKKAPDGAYFSKLSVLVIT